MVALHPDRPNSADSPGISGHTAVPTLEAAVARWLGTLTAASTRRVYATAWRPLVDALGAGLPLTVLDQDTNDERVPAAATENVAQDFADLFTRIHDGKVPAS